MASFGESEENFDSLVGLIVGGKVYQTSRTTLMRYPDSFFSLLLEGSIPSAKDDQGNYVIDRDGEVFRHVLTFLRYGELVSMPQGFQEFELLRREADFFLLDKLKVAVDKTMSIGLLFDGGKVFHTTRENLSREEGSFFSRMLTGEIEVTRDTQGNYVMDRDGSLFRHILSYLRDGGVLTDINLDELNRLRIEAEYFALDVFEKHIQSIQFMHNRRDSLPFLHFYYCVNSPCFVYTNTNKFKGFNVSRVCPNLPQITEGVFAGLVELQRIKDEGTVSEDDIVSYFCEKMRTNGEDVERAALSLHCKRLDFAPF